MAILKWGDLQERHDEHGNDQKWVQVRLVVLLIYLGKQ